MCNIKLKMDYQLQSWSELYSVATEALTDMRLKDNAEAFGANTGTCSRYTRRAEADPA